MVRTKSSPPSRMRRTKQSAPNGSSTTGRRPGRPRKIQTPEEFDNRVDAYVAEKVAAHRPLTWAGMALYLGFCSRQSMFDYEQMPEFAYSVKRARTLVEEQIEEQLCERGSNGNAIFRACQKWVGYSNPRYEHKFEGSVGHKHDHTVDWNSLPDDALRAIVAKMAPEQVRRVMESADGTVH